VSSDGEEKSKEEGGERMKAMKWVTILMTVAAFDMASAANYFTVENAAGNWNDTAIWAGGNLPQASDSAYVRSNATVTVNSYTTPGLALVGAGWINQTGTLTVGTGGVLNTTTLQAGREPTSGHSTGLITLNGGGEIKATGVQVGSGLRATGIMTINGGTFSASTVVLGHNTELDDTGDKFVINGSSAIIGTSSHFTINAGTLEFNFDAAGISTLSVAGNMQYGSGSNAKAIVIDGTAYTGGQNVFTLITAGNLIAFNEITLKGFGPEYEATYNYDTTAKALTVSVIPEPVTLGLLGSGMLVLMAVRRMMRS
jgi:hypothetical protein